MQFQSVIKSRGAVDFPSFMVERVYMREFYKKDGLPRDLQRWQGTVDQMLEGVDTSGPIYLMVDSTIVKAGTAQRREGLHIDGYWNPGLRAHGTGHLPSPGGHRPTGGHSHGQRRHMAFQGDGKWQTPPGWDMADFKEPEAIILASSLSAARGFIGEYEGPIGEGGDCSHIDLSGMKQVRMESHRVYACNVTGLHESLPVSMEGTRQLVRLNVPGWTV